MKTKLLLIGVLLLTLTACPSTGKKKPITNQIQVEADNGDVVSVVINSDDYVEMTTDTAAEKSREECFKASAAMPTDSHAQVAREMRLLASDGKMDCGYGKFDAEVAVEEQKTERTKTRWGTGERIVGKGLLGAGIYGGAKVLGDIVETAVEGAGNKVTLDNGSTLEGNVGEGNQYQRDTITQTVEESEEDLEPGTPVVDFATCVAAGGDPVNTDGNVMLSADDGIYERCSDGEGGTIESV